MDVLLIPIMAVCFVGGREQVRGFVGRLCGRLWMCANS